MSLDPIEDRVLALGGLVQAAMLTDQIARSGLCDAACFNTVIHSLFVYDPDSTEAVYGGRGRLELGLRGLGDILRGYERARYQATIRYVMGLLYLERKVSADPDMLEVIAKRLQHTEKKMEHFSNEINAVSSSVSAIYQDTISNFKFRIQVTGSMQQLQNPANADKIRALLLAGVRSAVLWRQLGGRRWHLFLQRKKMLRAVDSLLKTP